MPAERGEGAQVGGVPGREDESARLAGQVAEGALEVVVHGEGAGHQAGGGGGGAVAVEGLVGRGDHAGVSCEPQVVVRGEVE